LKEEIKLQIKALIVFSQSNYFSLYAIEDIFKDAYYDFFWYLVVRVEMAYL